LNHNSDPLKQCASLYPDSRWRMAEAAKQVPCRGVV